MDFKIAGTMFEREQISQRVKELAGEISAHFQGEEIVVVGILKGASVFTCDLIRELDNDVILDFMMISSYGKSTKSSGIVKIIKDIDADIEGKNVIIVEDIIDTGLTMRYLKEYFEAKGCKDLKICTFLDKPERRLCDIKADFTGFSIPDKFVVGYGLDVGEKFRNLPYIGYIEV